MTDPVTASPALWVRMMRSGGRSPAYRYATAVASLLATVALFIQKGPSPVFLALGVVVLLALMVGFLMFSVLVELSKKPTGHTKQAALVLMWTFTVLVLLSAGALFTSAFGNYPWPLQSAISAKISPPPPPPQAPTEFKATYVGTVTSNFRGTEQRSKATVHLEIGLGVVQGTYENENGDSGTIGGRLNGNSLELQFASSNTPGKCDFAASLSDDRDVLKGNYVCMSADPQFQEGARVEMKRQP